MTDNNQRHQTGMTLVEVLVVLILVGFLSTLLMQGVGYVLSTYHSVERFQFLSSKSLLKGFWFRYSVESMIPAWDLDRQFRGDERSFQGFSLSPLGSTGHLPTKVSWQIVNGEVENTQLIYQEAGLDTWSILDLQGIAIRFRYKDLAGVWHKRWPVDQLPQEATPRVVAIFDQEDNVLMSAFMQLSYAPIENFNAR